MTEVKQCAKLDCKKQFYRKDPKATICHDCAGTKPIFKWSIKDKNKKEDPIPHDLLVKIISFMYNRNKKEYTMSEIFNNLHSQTGIDYNILYWNFTHRLIPYLEQNNVIKRITKSSPWKFTLLRNGL